MKKDKKQESVNNKKDKALIKQVKKDKKNKEPGKIKKFFQKIGRILSKKWLVNGTKTLILIAIIILIYIVFVYSFNSNGDIFRHF